jgi:hypothetical protein
MILALFNIHKYRTSSTSQRQAAIAKPAAPHPCGESRKFAHHSGSPTTFEAEQASAPRHKIPPDDLDPRQSTSQHVGLSGDSAHAQVHSQPPPGPQADGRVRTIPPPRRERIAFRRRHTPMKRRSERTESPKRWNNVG